MAFPPKSRILDAGGSLMAALLLAVVLPHVPDAAAQQSGNPATQSIRIPYGLDWGDSIDKIRGMIASVKAQETGFFQKEGGRQVLEAGGLGLGESLLRKTVFTFKDGSLVEIELQYGDPSWDAEQTTDFFDRTRRRINQRYDSGTLLVNRVKDLPSDTGAPKDMTYTLIVYEWSQPSVVLDLDYYSAEESEHVLRMVSLSYKTP